MAKQLIPEELDALIQEYLTDGIITDKERQVLLRKAEKLGLDVDEVDLYIDAQQYKADQQVDAAVRKQRGQACPFCGGSVPDLADKCPHCGQHITMQANEEIKEIIEKLEDALVEFKSGEDFARNKANVEKYIRRAQLYYSNNPKIQTLVEQVKLEMAEAEKKAKNAAIKQNIKQGANSAAKTAANILESIKDTIVDFIEDNPKVCIITVVIIGLIFLTKTCITEMTDSCIKMDSGYSPETEAVLEKFSDALAEGNLTKAEVYFAQYHQLAGHKVDSKVEETLASAYADKAYEAIKSGDLEKALSYKNKAGENKELTNRLVTEFIKRGQYQEAMDVTGYNSTYYSKKALEVLSACVADMVSKNEKDKARRFIMAHYKWCQSNEDEGNVKKHLLQLLNN